jgi:hypothetical protein
MKGKTEKKSDKKKVEKKLYEEPKILATYNNEELQEVIKLHVAFAGGGCGCGGGGSIP